MEGCFYSHHKKLTVRAVRKGNSKTNLYLRRTLSKTSTQDKTQRSIVQQLDIQNNENTFHNRNTLTTAKETTLEGDDQRNGRTDKNSDIGRNQTKT